MALPIALACDDRHTPAQVANFMVDFGEATERELQIDWDFRCRLHSGFSQ
jgi:hypothetical protein